MIMPFYQNKTAGIGLVKISKTNIGKILAYKTVSRGMLRWSSYFFVDI
jgi:hypothetical protein